MSLRDLEEHGVLLPEEEWGRHRLETTVRRGRLVSSFALAVASLVAIWLGAGGTWTWIGLGGFLVGLYVITWVCDRAVRDQRDRVQEERAAIRAEVGAAGDVGPDGAAAGEGRAPDRPA